MNYRHVYHAGNFADIFKHIVITRIIDYLKRKPQAFRVIDTHAGIGFYDLQSEEAQKTLEWKNGIGRFLSNPEAICEHPLLKSWYQVVIEMSQNSDDLRFYPGSPWLMRRLLRRQDRLSAIEFHPADYKILAQNFTGDFQTKTFHLDGWLALKSQLPPKEKRGMILIDPPFEEKDEFSQIVNSIISAYRRFAGGVYALWYPLKHYQEIRCFLDALYKTQIPKILRLELAIRTPSEGPSLDGSGMIIINPPYLLREEINSLAPLLLSRLSQDPEAKLTNEWIRYES